MSLFIPYEGLTVAVPGLGTTLACADGDGRGFDYDSTEYRARITAGVHLPGSDEGEAFAELSGRSFGPSALFYMSEVAKVEGFECVPQEGAVPFRSRLTVADDSNLRLSGTSESYQAVSMQINVNAANPTMSIANPAVRGGGISLAPAINGNLQLEIVRPNDDSDVVFWTLTGSHDQFPGWELYLAGQRVYGYNPAVAGLGAWSLTSSMAVKASGSMQIPRSAPPPVSLVP